MPVHLQRKAPPHFRYPSGAEKDVNGGVGGKSLEKALPISGKGNTHLFLLGKVYSFDAALSLFFVFFFLSRI